MTELQTLYAQAAERRAAGLPCNPRRDGLTDLDWLTLDEIDKVHALGLQAAIVRKLVAARPPSTAQPSTTPSKQ